MSEEELLTLVAYEIGREIRRLTPEERNEMSFAIRWQNRRQLPIRHVIVCEDDLGNQAAISDLFSRIFDPEGPVQVSYVPGALMCATLMDHVEVDLILLDHDMSHGNGSDLIEWWKSHYIPAGKAVPPVITFSGIPSNNEHMKSIFPDAHVFSKLDVIQGKANDLIKYLLKV